VQLEQLYICRGEAGLTVSQLGRTFGGIQPDGVFPVVDGNGIGGGGGTDDADGVDKVKNHYPVVLPHRRSYYRLEGASQVLERPGRASGP